MKERRWKRRPEGSNWGEFGDDDQQGRLNLITPQRRLAALREVHDGLVFPLSLPLDLPPPGVQLGHRHGPMLEWPIGQNFRLDDLFKTEGAIDIANDDRVTMFLQHSTQWDALAHVGAMFDADDDGVPEYRYYNGFSGEFSAQGVCALGIERMAETCVQGRGVLVNLEAAFGRQGTLVGCEKLMNLFGEQNIVVEPGDILCLYTGFGDMLVDVAERRGEAAFDHLFSVLDGNDPDLLQWITESGLAAICADNIAVEGKPSGLADGTAHCHPGSALLPLHHHCLFKLGIHLGELWYFRDLASWLGARQRSRFLLTAPPLRLPGAVGSPVMPVGTV